VGTGGGGVTRLGSDNSLEEGTSCKGSWIKMRGKRNMQEGQKENEKGDDLHQFLSLYFLTGKNVLVTSNEAASMRRPPICWLFLKCLIFLRFGGSCHSFYLFCLFHTYIYNRIHAVQYSHPYLFAEASLLFNPAMVHYQLGYMSVAL
jgi:hypothetical protein